jgi:phosphohistidine phosphatase
MKVLLIRHAHAIDQDHGLPDDARYLTGKGRRAARVLGERLRREGLVPDVVVTSPLTRAVQTAELLAQAVGFQGEVTVLVELSPEGSPRRAAAALEWLGAVVAAVGHEPTISATAAHLGGRSSHPPMKKAQAVVVARGKIVAVLDHGELGEG